MPVFLIAFDLNSNTKDYMPFISLIKQKDSIQLSNRAFALHTGGTPDELYDELVPFLDKRDPLYVIPLAGPFRGRGLKDKNAWLVERLDINIYHADGKRKV